LSKEAAMKNYLVMKQSNFDLAKALRAQSNSPLGYGSEFKPPEILEPLFKLHPNWKRVKAQLL
jgi:hypothetical protein